MEAQLAYISSSGDVERASGPPTFSESWVRSFCERNEISVKVPVKLSKSRFEAVNRLKLMSFIALIESFFSKHHIPAENIWTCDETTSIPKKGETTKLLSAKGKPLFDRKSPIKVPKFSLLCCISASGERIPPLLMMPCVSEKNRAGPPPQIGPARYLKDWNCAWTPRGSMNSELFASWLTEDFAEKSSPKSTKLAGYYCLWITVPVVILVRPSGFCMRGKSLWHFPSLIPLI